MNYVDVAVEATPLSVRDAGRYEEDGASALTIGVPVQIGFWKAKNTDIGILTGPRLDWQEDPGGMGVSGWEIPVEFAVRRYFDPGESAFQHFLECGLGPHLGLVLADYAPAMPDLAFGAHAGFGVAIGRGAVRGLFGARAQIVLSPWEYYGSAMTQQGDQYWSWSNSDARIDIYAGATFR